MKRKFCLLLSILFILAQVACVSNEDQTPIQGASMESGSGQVLLNWNLGLFHQEVSQGELVEILEDGLNEILAEKGKTYRVKLHYPKLYEREVLDGVKLEQIDLVREVRESAGQFDLVTMVDTQQEANQIERPYFELAKEGYLYEIERERLATTQISDQDWELAQIDSKVYGIGFQMPQLIGMKYSVDGLEKSGIDSERLSASIFENIEIYEEYRRKTGSIPIQWFGFQLFNYINNPLFLPCNNLCWEEGRGFVSIADLEGMSTLFQNVLELQRRGLVQSVNVETGLGADFLVTTIGSPIFNELPYEDNEEIWIDKALEDRKLLYIPNPSLAVYDPANGDLRTAILRDSSHPEEALDLLRLLTEDPDMANLMRYGTVEVIDQGKAGRMLSSTAFMELQYYGPRIANGALSDSTEVETADKAAFKQKYEKTLPQDYPRGFRFDPVPVLEQISRTNEVIGPMATSEISEEIRMLAFSDAQEVLERLQRELEDAGIDEIIQEANRQLEEWRKGSPS